MPVPTGVLWDRDPHTEAKHAMLAQYLKAWFPIIASSWSSTGATYVDAFAGPGEYRDGAIGSPLIALNEASQPGVSGHPTEMRIVLVEENKARFEHLKSLIEPRQVNSARTKLTIANGACERVLLPTLDSAGAWGGPMFVNLDGWGVDTPYAIVQRVGQNRSTEVLITFETQWFTRFATVEDVTAGDLVFGDKAWRAVANEPTQSKKAFLVDQYLLRLHDAGFPHTLTFEMVDEGGHQLLLVFGTTSELGVRKMKDAMWSVDKVRGQRFRDPRDINQLAFEALNDDPDLTLLRQQVLARLEGGSCSLAQLKEFALLNTLFKESHVDPVVRALADERYVNRTSARRHEDVIVELAPHNLFMPP
jgi:three-Cys-motif partner protein